MYNEWNKKRVDESTNALHWSQQASGTRSVSKWNASFSRSHFPRRVLASKERWDARDPVVVFLFRNIILIKFICFAFSSADAQVTDAHSLLVAHGPELICRWWDAFFNCISHARRPLRNQVSLNTTSMKKPAGVSATDHTRMRPQIRRGIWVFARMSIFALRHYTAEAVKKRKWLNFRTEDGAKEIKNSQTHTRKDRTNCTG